MSDSAVLPPRSSPAVEAFREHLWSIDISELRSLRDEYAAFAGEFEDEFPTAGLARVALPVVELTLAAREVFESGRERLEQELPNVDLDAFFGRLRALDRARRQLDSDTPLEELIEAAAEQTGGHE